MGRRRRWRVTAALIAAGMTLSTAGCGGDDKAGGGSGTGSVGAVTVAAAASLTAAFKDIGTAFERANPGSTVQFNFAGSSTLATQLTNGAPGDVFASGDEANMKKVTDAQLADGTPQTFARNKLAIVVAPGNPEKITGLADLNRPGLIVSLCAPQVPIGKYAREAYQKAGVPFPSGGSQELDVKQVVSRVQQGQADAGIAYVTDVSAAGSKLAGVTIPDEANVTARYPAVALTKGSNPAGGKAFAAYLLSPDAQAVLTRYGFLTP